MAVRVQNLSKKNFDERSVHSGSHVSAGFQPWWNSNEREIALFLPQNLSLEEETPSKLYKPKHLDIQTLDQESTSSEVIGQPHPGKGVKEGTASPFYSSESGQAQSCGKDVEGQMKPVFSINNSNNVFGPSNPNYNHSMAPAQYAYADVYFGGLFSPYGQPAFAQMGGGSAPARIPLPLDLAEDGPVYVNAKQYNGILRRRRHRAKLEAQNKLVKSRKPYLHESRHRHALNRVRGSGGRFLSKNKLTQPPNPAFNLSSRYISDASCLDRMNSGSELESYSRVADCSGSSTSCSDISSISNNNGNFQQPKLGFTDISPGVSSMCNGIQHYASVAL